MRESACPSERIEQMQHNSSVISMRKVYKNGKHGAKQPCAASLKCERASLERVPKSTGTLFKHPPLGFQVERAPCFGLPSKWTKGGCSNILLLAARLELGPQQKKKCFAWSLGNKSKKKKKRRLQARELFKCSCWRFFSLLLTRSGALTTTSRSRSCSRFLHARAAEGLGLRNVDPRLMLTRPLIRGCSLRKWSESPLKGIRHPPIRSTRSLFIRGQH